jgi:hypothetical protein
VDGVRLRVRVGGEGEPVVVRHGQLVAALVPFLGGAAAR